MKIKSFLKIIIHLLITVFLTFTTQIGGVIYLITLLLFSDKKPNYKFKRTIFFIAIYLVTTFLIVPKVAPIFGRVKLEDNHRLEAHHFITKLFNRNYVTPKMNSVLKAISLKTNKELPHLKVIYLDANFPFIDGFPLLPHLSHNDGKKIDLSFIYQDKKGKTTNLKPSNSGYGIFVEPTKNEINQTNICKNRGFWQYDFTKYFTLGSFNKNLKLSEKATKKLILKILENNKVSKVFIEPHLKSRLNLNNSKIRFHGCGAVRHDDHIHFQIK
ncbi:hypothetical protein [Polaribacter sp. SA4-12]|uniref:hypothetical protein n=1 Tax=Polaribacter sp. SA4-12 TaxID=1312072 RepID=UPI000B3C52D2|nr:hypothetical protein [Polaribacter sp. SA4-12]ARV16496.1 hypothetical protein BTO07_15725 [Polaribacter sp. SA4-12]